MIRSSAVRPVLWRRVMVVGLTFLALLVTACSTTAPRYRVPSGRLDAADFEYDDASCPALVREELAREDDKKVDVNKAGSIMMRELDDTPVGVSRDKFLLDILAFMGVPYSYGGTTKDGIDCSGFTSLIFASAVDIPLPRSAREQYHIGSKVQRGNLRFGDLVFFNTTGRRPSHVGIYLENDMFAHASISEGVTLSSLESKYYKKRFIGARRVIE